MLMRRTRVLLLLVATHSPAERKDFFSFFLLMMRGKVFLTMILASQKGLSHGIQWPSDNRAGRD